tara:strand:- start:525 stop:692 length:168 start_codon:yes stop_codon:yes gene_type:complete
MKVGDLVRWRLFGEVGIVLSIKKYPLQTHVEIYSLSDKQIFCARETDLEVISEGG